MELSKITDWRCATNTEVFEYLNQKANSSKKYYRLWMKILHHIGLKKLDHFWLNKASPESVKSLVIRKSIKPIDFYTYLKARFGEPSGPQTMLGKFTGIKEDSANMIHWDYLLYYSGGEILITGFTREIHIHISESLSKEKWIELITLIKKDFGKWGKKKGQVLRSLENWNVIQNKFVALTDLSEALHEEICSELKHPLSLTPAPTDLNNQSYQETLRRVGKRAKEIYGKCLQLRLLTPIIFEAFFNLLFLVLLKEEYRNDEELKKNFREQSIHHKIDSIHDYCYGFDQQIDKDSFEYKEFMKIRARRNDDIHANCSPEKEYFEKVYFDKKTPIYENPGDNIHMFWVAMEELADPENVVDEYQKVLAFIYDIAGSLTPPYWQLFKYILEERLPGYDLKRKIFGVLFPDFVPYFSFGIQYDDEYFS